MEPYSIHTDVLLHIISVADIKTKSRVVKTCRSLYYEGGKALLKSTDVQLCTRRQIASFLFFMHGDAPGRFPSLRTLRLQSLPFPQEASDLPPASFFLVLGERATGLKTLEVEPSISMQKTACEELARAVPKLSSLTDLKAWLVDPEVLQTAILSHLVRADIGIFPPHPMPGTLVDLDLAHLLQGSRDTLESLTLVSSGHNICTTEGPAYTRLRTLRLKGPWLPNVAHYMASFPALESISVSHDVPSNGDYTFNGEASREENKRYQRMHGSWPSLKYVSATPQHLHLLGLTCHVHHVCLHQIYDEVDLDVMRATLDDVRPVRIEMTSYTGGEFVRSQWLSAPREPPLRHLKITISIECFEVQEVIDLDDAIVSLHLVLSPFGDVTDHAPVLDRRASAPHSRCSLSAASNSSYRFQTPLSFWMKMSSHTCMRWTCGRSHRTSRTRVRP